MSSTHVNGGEINTGVSAAAFTRRSCHRSGLQHEETTNEEPRHDTPSAARDLSFAGILRADERSFIGLSTLNDIEPHRRSDDHSILCEFADSGGMTSYDGSRRDVRAKD